MTKDELLNKYSLYLRIDKRLSKKTEDVYLQVAREYLFFLNENNIELTDDELTEILNIYINAYYGSDKTTLEAVKQQVEQESFVLP